jgi:hypothetical protein
VIELPQIYRGALMKGDPNDLVKVAVQVGRFAERLEETCRKDVELVKPATWKGQIPKDVHHRRARARLLAEEVRVLERVLLGVPAAKQHNVLDAVALGLYAVGRRA